MTSIATRTTQHALESLIHPLEGSPADFDPLLEQIGNARFVLIGEASHGTHEFYKIRAEITKRLITEMGFNAVAIEGDWPDANRVHRYIVGGTEDGDATEALSGFERFPQWMWRNADVLDFVGWLRTHNEQAAPGESPVGFYGLDLYSLHASMAAVLNYLDRVDPEAAHRARLRYACFDRFGSDLQRYGYATTLGLTPSCEADVVAQLIDMRRGAGAALHGVTPRQGEDAFYAEQNARLVANAERYYRAMFDRHDITWNLRDQHMAGTLDALEQFLRRDHRAPRIVVWAHNSHVGDARATERHRAGEVNIGELVRSAHPAESMLIGFSTYTGTVTAASDWDEPAERKRVLPALSGSCEALFHEATTPNFLLSTHHPDAATLFANPRLQRAIGVIYRPDTERQSHYYHVQLAQQFDAVLHYDSTRAVEPLQRTGLWEAGELPETYPSAL